MSDYIPKSFYYNDYEDTPSCLREFQHLPSIYINGPFDLIDMKIPEMVEAVLRRLRQNRDDIVEITDTCVSDECGESIINAIVDGNRTIVKFNLSDNYNLGVLTGAAVAGLLKVNNTLTSLDLGSNSIGDETVTLILKSLEKNTTLKYLGLKSNELEDHAGTAVADMLLVNNTITSLDISGNNFSYCIGILIAKAIEINTGLTNLNVSWSFEEDDTEDSIQQALDSKYRGSKYNTAVICIQRAWRECRYNPLYKMCEIVQLGSLARVSGLVL